MIALTLKNSFLSELNSVFFFKFTYHALKEFQLVLFLDNFSFNFDHNFFFNSFFVEAISSDLSEELESLHTSSPKTLVIKIVTVSELSLFTSIKTGPVFVVGEKYFLQTLDSPLVNPGFYDRFKSLVLNTNKLVNGELLTFLSNFFDL